MCLRPSANNKSRGFILMGVVIPLFALLTLTGAVAVLLTNRWAETQKAIDQGTMAENVDAILWAIRYYYHNAAVSAAAPLDATVSATIIQQTLATLGYSGGGDGTWAVSSSPLYPNGLELRITSLSQINPGSPRVLTQTGTFLDGREVSQGSYTFTIEQRSGDSGEVVAQTNTLIFCQVPSDSLALSSLSDWQNLSGNLASFAVQGTAFVRGKIDGVSPVNFPTDSALVAGSYGDHIARGNQSLSAFTSQSDYRYQTEIAQSRLDLSQASTDLRAANAQRVALLRSPIPISALLREGQSGDPALTATQAQIYRANQPFYSVPQANRYWLAHDPSTGLISAAAAQFLEPNYSAGSIPPVGGWVLDESVKMVAGVNQVVVRIDPDLAPNPLFIGSIKDGVYGDYANFIVEIDSAPSLFDDFKLITPNTIVIGGDLNIDGAHNLTLLGAQVYFGYSHLNQVIFTGSLASLGGVSPSPWRNANGAEHQVAQVTLKERPQGSSPIFYYLTLLQRQR